MVVKEGRHGGPPGQAGMRRRAAAAVRRFMASLWAWERGPSFMLSFIAASNSFLPSTAWRMCALSPIGGPTSSRPRGAGSRELSCSPLPAEVPAAPSSARRGRTASRCPTSHRPGPSGPGHGTRNRAFLSTIAGGAGAMKERPEPRGRSKQRKGRPKAARVERDSDPIQR